MATTYNSDDALADPVAADYVTLRDRFVATAKIMDVLAGERKVLADEMRKREKEASIKLRLGTLSEADKALYRDVISSPYFN
jgi:hypothetical protein